MVDRPVDRTNQPELISLEAPHRRRLVSQVNIGVVAVQDLGDPAEEVVDLEREGVGEPPFAGPLGRVGTRR
jgi:hypothetical protein